VLSEMLGLRCWATKDLWVFEYFVVFVEGDRFLVGCLFRKIKVRGEVSQFSGHVPPKFIFLIGHINLPVGSLSITPFVAFK